jgi:hypothetical protein
MAGKFSFRDLIAMLRVKLDKASAQQTEKELTGSFDRIGVSAKKLAGLVAAAFSGAVMLRFAQVSVQAAIEAERVWNRLSGTLASVNIEFAKVETRVRAGARAMREAAGIGDDEYAGTLGRLVSLTGDFNLAMTNMGLVADVAARYFGGDLAPAVDLVAKALNGQTRSLREVGIVTKDVNEGLRILRERSAGAASNEMRSLDGRLRLLKDSLAEVREEFGFLILRVFGGKDTEISTNRFRMGLDRIADALSRIKFNAKDIVFPKWDSFFGFSMDPKTPPPSGPRFTHRGWQKIPGATETPEEKAAREADEKRQREDAQRRADEALALRIRIEQEREARRIATANRMHATANASGISSRLQGGFSEIGGLGELQALPDSEALNQFATDWSNMWDNISSATENAAMGIAGAFQDTFALIIDGSENLVGVVTEMARGVAAALIGGVAQYAGTKAGEQVAEGIAKLAEGTWPPNPAAWSAAGLHFKSAGLWAILAGGAGAVQGAIGGGGRGGISGGIPSGATDIGGRIAQQNVPKNQTIIYIDGFNPKNGEHVRVLSAGMKEVARTDSSIDIRSRSGAR